MLIKLKGTQAWSWDQMKFALSAAFCVLLSPLDAMHTASRLSTRATTRSRPLVRRMSTVPVQQSRLINDAPKHSSMAGVMIGLALMGAGYYAWEQKDVIFQPSHNVDLDSYMENFGKVDKILDLLDTFEVEPNSKESLDAWKTECESITLASNLPHMLKWSLWAQATNSNVWYKEDLRSFFHAAVVKSYLKLDRAQRLGILISGTEQFVDRLYELRVVDLETDFKIRSAKSGMTKAAFSDLFKNAYGRSAGSAAEQSHPTIDEFCRALHAIPHTTEESREALYYFFGEVEKFQQDTLEIRRMIQEPFDIEQLLPAERWD